MVTSSISLLSVTTNIKCLQHYWSFDNVSVLLQFFLYLSAPIYLTVATIKKINCCVVFGKNMLPNSSFPQYTWWIEVASHMRWLFENLYSHAVTSRSWIDRRIPECEDTVRKHHIFQASSSSATYHCRVLLKILDNVLPQRVMRYLNSLHKVQLFWQWVKHAISWSLIVRNREAFVWSNPVQPPRYVNHPGGVPRITLQLLDIT